MLPPRPPHEQRSVRHLEPDELLERGARARDRLGLSRRTSRRAEAFVAALDGRDTREWATSELRELKASDHAARLQLHATVGETRRQLLLHHDLRSARRLVTLDRLFDQTHKALATYDALRDTQPEVTAAAARSALYFTGVRQLLIERERWADVIEDGGLPSPDLGPVALIDALVGLRDGVPGAVRALQQAVRLAVPDTPSRRELDDPPELLLQARAASWLAEQRDRRCARGRAPNGRRGTPRHAGRAPPRRTSTATSTWTAPSTSARRTGCAPAR